MLGHAVSSWSRPRVTFTQDPSDRGVKGGARFMAEACSLDVDRSVLRVYVETILRMILG